MITGDGVEHLCAAEQRPALKKLNIEGIGAIFDKGSRCAAVFCVDIYRLPGASVHAPLELIGATGAAGFHHHPDGLVVRAAGR